METETRPWGSFTTIVKNAKGATTVKVITVNPDSRTSLQKHAKRSEEWLCLTGTAVVEIDGVKTILHKGGTATVPVGSIHRIGSEEGCEILEVSTGEFYEEDIIRFSDDYGRA